MLTSQSLILCCPGLQCDGVVNRREDKDKSGGWELQVDGEEKGVRDGALG